MNLNRRGYRWLLLAFACAWFGVLVPVHQRGIVQLPGPARCHPCCPDQVETAAAGGKCPAPDPAKGKDPSNCAICYFIATLDVPPPLTIYVPRLDAVAVDEVSR